jgi:hypothetical protein
MKINLGLGHLAYSNSELTSEIMNLAQLVWIDPLQSLYKHR